MKPEAKQPAAKPTSAKSEQERSFRLRDDELSRLSLGSTPRISLAKGDTYTTSDTKLADRLATVAELEEV